MLALVLEALRTTLPPFEVTEHAVNCHHNYVARERHFGAEVWVTRKGAWIAVQCARDEGASRRRRCRRSRAFMAG